MNPRKVKAKPISEQDKNIWGVIDNDEEVVVIAGVDYDEACTRAEEGVIASETEHIVIKMVAKVDYTPAQTSIILI